MPIIININDSDLAGFNDQAKQELELSVKTFSDDLIAEANRIESSVNSTSQGPEITSSIVRDAKVLIRHKISKPKKHIGSIILKIAASVFSLIAGTMYQKENLQNTIYLVLYIIVIALAILLTTLTVIKEN
ncbi:hypothetical protein LT679_14670 [Mucilaginibacter roseus]|uniref:Phage holin family protein n=1 Tax=Mucilaginibacter roseus TaxID=1528868 RepID=A0ABS8U7H1_9SPHI|nr:hypothetical protein [Mucilaginibacter roseus]MCD8741857.1 hypothetical protein [Mucilaginibacter roseus]